MALLPHAVFALDPGLIPELFPAETLERLCAGVRCDPGHVLRALDDPVLRTAEILITGWGAPYLGAGLLGRAPGLGAVIHTAGSVKQLVSPLLLDQGVTVSSAASANARPTAEFAVAAMLLAAKRAFTEARALAAGLPAAQDTRDSGWYRLTVGVIGASRVGRLVMELLRAYDVRILVCDPYLDPKTAAALGVTLTDLDALCAASDVVSVHAPQLPTTAGMLGERRLALIRDGGIIVNTARGSLIDTEALTRHCATGRLDAVLDVTDPEPLPPGHALLHMPNVLVTPHLAGSRGRELRRLGEFAVAEVERYLGGEPVAGAVTPEEFARSA
ncbi:Phosphoglycerate dehydrogenase [Actinacidiphila alni]|uniref:Phosphoglycerate dehydrogenase n=1 Tax=Actinacidiphila alni TaxID=380248 RepID=A0A1I2L8P5_9ACTN|nr:hydroxyacid dehydrogenase [Actinacidiphila alni]SFF75732.1 Phosphoglycerate dehydrogenase [Actinacidiphila alni]